MKSSSDSPCPGRFTRLTATVTIWAPDASMASRMFSKDGYLPVPTMSRDLNSLPASHNDVSYISLPPSWFPLSLPSPPAGARDNGTLSPLGRGRGEGPQLASTHGSDDLDP